jgi:DNA end-binding protein Ku
MLRPMGDGLAMHQLLFKAEVRDIKDLGVESAPVSEPELKLANQLIEQLAAKKFDPDEYADEHRVRVEAAIQRKVEGKEVTFAEPPVAEGAPSNVVDLMEILKASLSAKGGKAAEAKEERKAPKKAPASGTAAPARKASKR